MRIRGMDLVSLCLSLLLLGYCTPAIAIAVDGISLTTIREGSDREPVVRRSTLERRDGARFTYYDTGLGACGQYNEPSDFIVALNAPQWDGGSHCFKMITVSYGGKSTQAQIVDRCAGCPANALDFSEGLFTYFASTSAGVIYGDWSYNNGTLPASSSTTTAKSASPTTDQATVTSPPTSSSPASASAPSPPLHNLQNLRVALVELGSLITTGADFSIQGNQE